MSYGETQQLPEHSTSRTDPVANCAIACIELVDYPKKPVREQMTLAHRLDELLDQALAGVPVAERIVLDAGDGVAIVFPCNPEQCLVFACALAARVEDALQIRVGLNVGPVRLVRSDKGQPAFVGDCLEVGRQIAAFADAGCIVASHAFYEAIVAVSASHASRFVFEGTRTDASVREHRLYALRAGPPAAARAGTRLQRWGESAAAKARRLASAAAGIRAGIVRRPPLATALAVALIVAGAAALRPPSGETPIIAVADRQAEAAPHRTQNAAGSSPPVLAASAPDAPAAHDMQAALPEPLAPEPAAKVPMESIADPLSATTSNAQPPAQPASAPVPTSRERQQAKAPVGPAGQPAAEPSVQPAAKPLPPQRALARSAPSEPRVSEPAVVTGALRLTVIPWGEIYLDGQKLGVAPPLRDVVLEPGVYRIEIRNPGFASLMQLVEVNAGEQVRIRHKFD